MAHDPSEEVTPLIGAPAPASYPTADYPTADYPTPSYPPPPQASNYPPAQYPPAQYPPAHTQYPPANYPPNYAPPNYGVGALPPPSSLPPSYYPTPTPVPNAQGMLQVPCRVCGQTIQYSAAKKMSAVKCTNCQHATQVGPPPQGKNFILCQCNSLLTVNATAKAATCPKPHCKKTLILAPEDPGKSRAFCSHCNTLLTYRSSSAVVVCPKCRGRSVVSRSKLHWYIGINVIIGFLFIFLGLFFTLGSYELSDGGFYFVFWGFCLTGVLAIIRAIVYSSMNWRARDAVYVPV